MNIRTTAVAGSELHAGARLGPLQTLRLLRTLVHNPLEAWPPDVYRQPMFRSRFLGQEELFVMDPELVHEVLVDQHDAFARTEITLRILGPALGDAILTADGNRWRWQRRIAAPIFRPEKIEEFVPAMIDTAQATSARWRALPEGTIIPVLHEMTRTTFDIIVETMLSGPQSIDITRVAKAITDALSMTGWVMATTLLRVPNWVPYPGKACAEKARQYLRGEVRRLVEDRIRSGVERNDLIGLLLSTPDPETGEAMDRNDVADNILTFITAGHETTAVALTWTLCLLSQHPQNADRVASEVEAVTAGGSLRPEHVGSLVYTRQVLQEAMRLYPPVPLLARKATRDLKLAGRHPVANGSTVFVPIFALHRHQSLWPEPDRFNPARFEPASVKERHRYAYLPFGAGPRICIGMGFALTEATTILATILREFRLTNVGEHPPGMRMMVTLRPASSMPMAISSRVPVGLAACSSPKADVTRPH